MSRTTSPEKWSPLIEADLVASARRGEALGWEALVRQHQEAVFRLAYLLLGDADEAQDVAQEAFIRAHQALARFDASRPLRPWLLRIAANLARNRRRAVGRYLAALQRALRSEPETRPNVEQVSQQQMEAQLLWQAVRRLDQRDQDIIYLRFFLELPEAEAAAALQLPPGTAKSRLHRALKRLRVVIDRHFPELREMFEA
jgi:RNA polymerase sigma-70 factor, ECF subfamily